MVAEQRQLRALEQRLVDEDQVTVLPVVESVGQPAFAREAQHVAGGPARHVEHRRVIRIHHPPGILPRVPEQERLVFIVGVDVGVPVQMVGRQVREHADHGGDARRVVQLVRGGLEGDPRRRARMERHLAQRPSDVPRHLGLEAELSQQVPDDVRHGGLAVRAGDGDVPDALERAKRQLELGDHRSAGGARGHERRRGGRDAGTRHDQGGPGDAFEVVPAGLHVRPGGLERRRDLLDLRRGGPIRGIDRRVMRAQQPGRRVAAAPEAEHRHFALPPEFGCHRSLRVVRATKAQRMPRIQKRTTTWDSFHPFSSK